MDRRYFVRLAALVGLAGVLGKPAAGQTPGASPSPDKATAERQHLAAMAKYGDLTGGEKLVIGMLVYPGMFLQDLVGPLTVFEALMNREIHLLWKNPEPVGNESAGQPALIPVKPTTTFAQCPDKLDVLFVPGGVPGTLTMMEDAEVLAFLAEKGRTAGYVTSVCTGSLILGAAGLLEGYKAATYWALQDVLEEVGAIPAPGRVVVDRNRVTGGGGHRRYRFRVDAGCAAAQPGICPSRAALSGIRPGAAV
jgi:cyclohexyl-isocyanide hydratase